MRHPRRNHQEQTAGAKALGCDDEERHRAGKDEEEDREQPLIGDGADLQPPRARVDILVDLPDADPPDEGGDGHGYGRRQLVRRGAAEVLDEPAVAPVSFRCVMRCCV